MLRQRTSSSALVTEGVVVDASVMVDLLIGSSVGPAVTDRLRGRELHAPAHLDAEVLSVLGRLERGRHLSRRQVETRLERLTVAPITRHALPDLVVGAWKRRHNLRLVDALYVELAGQLDVTIVTTDAGMAAAAANAEFVGDPE